ncbi:sugar kinase, partial [Streptomyces sp. NPDC059455]
MGIVAGLDSSSESTRIVVCDTDTGAVIKQGYAPHPVGGSGDVDPQAWLMSLGEAAEGGLLEGVQAIGVSAQQHGLLALDAGGVLVRPALVGNDKRAQAAGARGPPPPGSGPRPGPGGAAGGAPARPPAGGDGAG